MRTETPSILTLAFLLGCGTSPENPLPGGGGGDTSTNGGTGGQPSAGTGGVQPSAGTAPTAGSAPAAGQSSGGTMGGTSNGGIAGGVSVGGTTAGTPGNAGGSSAGTPAGGSPSAGTSGGGRSGGGAQGTAGAAGRPSGGAGGEAGGAATGGSGGSGTCVENLACKLSPPPSTGDLHQDCVDRINQFRTQCACLPPLARRTDGEACADQMAEYDAAMNSAHAGVQDNICQPGGAQNSCPGYSSNNQVISLCLQQMWDEGPPPMTPCNGSCFQEYGHFINMTDTSVTRVACGFYTTSAGKVWSVQNFTR